MADKARTDLDAFIDLYLAKHVTDAKPEFHWDINQILMADARRIAIAAPRGHAKSTVVALGYVLWAALTGRKRFIVLCSDTSGQASNLLRDVKQQIEMNDEIIRDFGKQENIDDKWSESSIVLKNGCRIDAVGAGKSMRGLREKSNRPDLIICDDLENDEGVASKTGRDKLRQWYTRVLENMLDPKSGRIAVIGTILHPFSLLSELTGNDGWTSYEKRIFSAVHPDGTILFPSRFSADTLQSIRKRIGEWAFACEYQNKPIDDEAKMFRLSWLKFYDALPDNLVVISAIDPAVSERESADYTACVTIGLDPKSRNIFILDIYRKRGTVLDHARSIQGIHARWKPSTMWCEDMAFQSVWKNAVLEYSKAVGIYLPIRGVKNLKDKQMRIQSLQSMFENGQILLRKDMREFIEDEYDLYPNVDHDDALDALEVAVRHINNRGGIQ